MKTLHMTDQHHEALKLLVDRGIQELRCYLQETSDPRMDGYSDEEVADLRRLDEEDAAVIQRVVAGLEPPVDYIIRSDGIFDPYYAYMDDDVGTMVTGTHPTREAAVQGAWHHHLGE